MINSNSQVGCTLSTSLLSLSDSFDCWWNFSRFCWYRNLISYNFFNLPLIVVEIKCPFAGVLSNPRSCGLIFFLWLSTLTFIIAFSDYKKMATFFWKNLLNICYYLKKYSKSLNFRYSHSFVRIFLVLFCGACSEILSYSDWWRW